MSSSSTSDSILEEFDGQHHRSQGSQSRQGHAQASQISAARRARDFYYKRQWYKKGPDAAEKLLFDKELHKKRWSKLIEHGKLDAN